MWLANLGMFVNLTPFFFFFFSVYIAFYMHRSFYSNNTKKTFRLYHRDIHFFGPKPIPCPTSYTYTLYVIIAFMNGHCPHLTGVAFRA